MRIINTIIDKISKVFAIISIICVFILAMMYGFDIIGRLVFSTQIVGTFEIAQFLLCLITFLAFPFAQKTRSHIHVAFIIAKFPEKIKYVVSGIGFIICSVCASFMVYALWLQGSHSIGTKLSQVLSIPYAPMYYIASVLMCFFGITLLIDAIRSFLAAVGNEEAKSEVDRIFVN